ncbi:MAG TPA: hypothetical protein VH500_16240 [Nitrososphaeraceae archaeon]|jgi:hypothetical protein
MPANFNPYQFAGVQQPPMQTPIPNTNIDPVAQSYARMMNQSYIKQGQPVEAYQ